MERTPQPRYPFRCEVRFCCPGNSGFMQGVIGDISVSGCYVETITPERKGTHLDLTFQTNGKQFMLPGIVQVEYPTMGMGIDFQDVNPETATALHSLVQSQASRA